LSLLRTTWPNALMEDSPRDWYWGIGADGKGENRLGQLLEQVRDELWDYVPPPQLLNQTVAIQGRMDFYEQYQNQPETQEVTEEV